jgi:predicted enzyme related to lactoylglutathione lyase
VDMRLELVPLPSTDVDRSKAFYVDQVGFHLDHDVEPGNGMRVVQLTPPGAASSIVVGVGISDLGGGVRYAYFSDPDGNSWALQQISR